MVWRQFPIRERRRTSSIYIDIESLKPLQANLLSVKLILDCSLSFNLAPVVKWISRWSSEPLLGVRVPPGVPINYGKGPIRNNIDRFVLAAFCPSHGFNRP